MKITQRRDGETLVFQLDGKMAVGAGEERAREAIKAALAAGETRILLDMEHVTMLDSEGVGDLLASHTSAKRSGAKMAMVHLSPRVGRVLQVTNLIGVLDVYDDSEEALRALD
ncbi:MAG TPA: STAS domain-containing protein [Thermoanaerobaculia bacterium]|nr:STAS domain-containing protein [Thermoanaerobaculia bacterium]